MKRIFATILAFVMMAVTAVPAFAAVPGDTVVSPQYTYIQSNYANLTINESTGVATCTSSCYATSVYTVSIECKLQRYTGTSWSTVKTWTTSANRYANISQTWTVPSGYTYRVYSTYRIYNSSGTLLETGTNSKSYAYPQN